MKLPVAVEAMKGIGNLAARSGSSTQQAAGAMYNLGQAIGEGALKLMDWNSIEIAGMGTIEFKQQLIDTAVSMGTLKKAGDGVWKTLEGTTVTTKNFQTTLKDGWATGEVVTDTLGRYADTTKGIGKESAKAATEVKTFSMMMTTLKAAAGTGWTDTFETVIGNLPEATALWTGMTNAIGGFIGASADARNKVLGDWKALGGRTALIEGIKNVFEAIGAVLKPIRDAFRDIFPRKTGQQLYDATIRFREFTEGLKIGEDAAKNLKRTFKGVFAVFSIIGQVIKGVIGVVGDLFGAFASGGEGGGGGFLSLTGGIGDFLVKVDDLLRKGTFLTSFFDGLGTVLALPIKLLKSLAGFLGSFFGGLEEGSDKVSGFSDKLSPLEALLEGVKDAFSGLGDMLGRVGELLAPLGDVIGDALGAIGEALSDAFTSGDFSDVLDAVNTGLFAALVLAFKKFTSGGLFGNTGGGGLFSSIKDSFGELTGVLSAMQSNLKANTLLKIAGAVALLTVSIVALSLIDSAKLTKALLAIGVAFGYLLGAMAIMSKVAGSKGFLKIPVIAAGLILLSTAILILSAAVTVLSKLDWEELAKGLLGVAALIGMVALAIRPLAKNASGMMRAGAGLILLAVALKILVSVVKDFSEMSWSDIGKGLAGVAGSLVVLVAAVRLMPSSTMLRAAISIGILAVSLKLLVSVVEDFGGMSWTTIGRGLLGVAGALAVIAATMRLMPKNMIRMGTGLGIVALALQGIASVVKTMGDMTWEEIARGLVALGGSLAILAAALRLMSGTLSGTAALMVAVVALRVLTPVLTTLGGMSWTSIIKGLVALAGVFTILGVSGLLLGPLAPVILALSGAIFILGAAMFLLGAGVALAGVGVLAFVTAITMLVAVGAAAAAVIGLVIAEVIKAIPGVLAAFAQGIVDWIKIIGDSAPDIAGAVVKIINAIIAAVKKLLPKIPPLMKEMLTTFLKVMKDAVPRLARAALNWLLEILKAISENIYRITRVTLDIIAKFLKGLADGLPKVIDAGVDLIVALIKGVSKRSNVRKITNAAFDAINDFANGVLDAVEDPENQRKFKDTGKRMASMIVSGLVWGLTNATPLGLLRRAGSSLMDAIRGGAEEEAEIDSPSKVFFRMGKDVDKGLANGLVAYSYLASNAGEQVSEDTIDAMKSELAKVSEIMAAEVDPNPVIAPVIDLTQFRDDAARFKKELSNVVSMANISAGQAASITMGAPSGLNTTATQLRAPVIQFEQNNYSPKTLSSVEIYRQTKNQLALAKEALVV